MLVPITTPTRSAPCSRSARAIGSSICASAASAIALLRQSYSREARGDPRQRIVHRADAQHAIGREIVAIDEPRRLAVEQPRQTSSAPAPSAFTMPSARGDREAAPAS